MKIKCFSFLAGFLLFACATGNVKETGGQEKLYDVIIVGAGGGGLGAAARLTQAGKSVLVIEQHDRVGGYMTNFRRGEYRFEVSLHAIDGLDPGGLTFNAFHKLGIYDRLDLVRMDPMYRSIYPDLVIDVPADVEAYARQLKKEFPREAEGIDALFAAFDRIYVAMKVGMDYVRGDIMRGLWGTIQNPKSVHAWLRCWNSTAAEMVGRYIQDKRLFDAFTQLSGFLGDAPEKVSAPVFAMMWNSYHRDGYYYLKGGSQAIADALEEVIRENGGEILVSTRVKKIILKDSIATGVETDDGRIYESQYVISNANAPATMFQLVGRELLPADYVTGMENMEIGASAFVVYLGVDHDYSGCFPGTHELFVNVGGDGGRATALSAARLEEEDPEKLPYVITNYTVVDPADAPAGKNVICLTTLMSYDWQKGWQEDIDYAQYTRLKNEVGMQLIKRAEKILPGLSDHVEVMEVGSPRTMKHYTLNPKGAIIGWANTPQQSMLKRLPQKTPVDNLFLAGAWTFPCGGQSAVIMSGLLAAEKILAQTTGDSRPDSKAE